jgi:uncharacterized membrane protein YfcA
VHWAEAIGLAGAAGAGGAINAVAGGGTLLTFPTLLFFGTPAIEANATSTLALLIGTSGSIFGFRRYLPAARPWLWRFVPISIVGSITGAIWLTHTHERVFSRLVPFLMLFATLLFLTQGLVRKLVPFDPASGRLASPHQVFWGPVLFQLLVAIYGGYFGAGIGILMLASLGFIGLTNIHEMNTLKTILGSLINLVAAVWFVISGLVNWPKAGVMIIGALAGYFLGAHYSLRIQQVRVRQIITGIGFSLSAITFYQQFVKK